MFYRTLTVSTAFLMLTACVSVGEAYDTEAVLSFVPGETTLDQAKAAAGKPMSHTYMEDGTQLVQWSHTQALYTSATSTHHAILFGKDGTMIRIVTDIRSVND